MALPVELDRSMTQITVWTRGVTLAKEARDTATLLAKAGKSEGMQTQSFDNYVDLPDRIGVACKSYARISDEPIETFYEYENQHHDVIVLVEETLIKGHDYLKGANRGCVVIVNTTREPETFLKWIGPEENLSRVRALATIDADSLGAGVTLTFDGTEGAADDTKIGAGIGAVIAGAAARVSGCVGLDALIAAAENPDAVQQGWERVQVLDL
jgi:Pyruvate/2-oxoacid:ferredoxin oxidoreductase gamma subunit